MEEQPILTDNQVRNLNRTFGLGGNERKYIRDYPVLHIYLANILGAAHEEAQRGNCVKLGLGRHQILNDDHIDSGFNADFWIDKLGDYKIVSCYASIYIISLDLASPDKGDIFDPDHFVLLTYVGQCEFQIFENGAIGFINLHQGKKQPKFINELLLDFPSKEPKYREELIQEIKRIGEEPDESYLAPIKLGKAITIEL